MPAKKRSRRTVLRKNVTKAVKRQPPASRVSRKKAAATPKKVAGPKTFDEMLTARSPQVRSIARRLRKLVYEVLPKAREAVYGGSHAITLYSLSSEICGIQPADDRCNFYLRKGAELPDPHGLLEGKGKAIRHVRIRSLAELPAEPIKAFLREGKKRANE